MNYCTNCGREIGSAQVCEGCGTPVAAAPSFNDETRIVDIRPDDTARMSPPPPPPPLPEREPRRSFPYGMLAAALVLAAVFGLLLGWGLKNGFRLSAAPTATLTPLPAASATPQAPSEPSVLPPAVATPADASPAAEPSAAAPTVAPPVVARPPRAECANPFVEASVTRATQPDYPQSARDLNLGPVSVEIEVTIGPDGEIKDAEVYRSSTNLAIDQSALRAARASTYAPKIVNCNPVAGRYLFRADFSPDS